MRRVAEVVAVLALGCALVLALWFVALLVFFQACDAEVGLVDASRRGRLRESPVAGVLSWRDGPVAAALAIAGRSSAAPAPAPVSGHLPGNGLLGVVRRRDARPVLEQLHERPVPRLRAVAGRTARTATPPAECDSY